VVYQAQSEGHYEGNVPFSWSGTDVNGNQVPDGYYTVMATGMVNGESQTIGTQVYGKVQSVVLGSGSSEATLNVEGFGTVSLNDVLEVAS
jgi:flagellar basal-body rod modification protein FlgD